MNQQELIEKLYDKDDTKAYKAFLELEGIVSNSNELYKYFDEFVLMLTNQKSYIRVRGFKLICANAKWDQDNKIEIVIEVLLNELDDEKPTAVRQCLKSLNELLLYKTNLFDVVKKKLKSLDYSKYKESMQPLIKKDIAEILSTINE